MVNTPYKFLEQKYPKLKKELEKHTLRGKVLDFVIAYIIEEKSK